MAVGGSTGSPAEIEAAKSALRARILTARRALSPGDLATAAQAIRDHAMDLPLASTVALFASTGTEPGTHPLLEALREAGTRVLLPVLRPDLGLDWGEYGGPESLVPGPRGTLEPAGPHRGAEALADAGQVFVPGVAVDRRGHRLGRGGGSYDRALRFADPRARVAVVLYADEIVDAVPVGDHDVPVHGVLSPAGFQHLGGAP